MKYWAFVDGGVPGAFAPEELARLRGFGLTTLVCPAEGDIQEKNWRRAGEFDDVSAAVSERERSSPPAPPLGAELAGSSPDAVIDAASIRIFGRVSELMAELESRRGEKPLIRTLQARLEAAADELQKARDRASALELRAARADELAEQARRDAAELARLKAALAAHDGALSDVRAELESVKSEAEKLGARAAESARLAAAREDLAVGLSSELAAKELSLAKALGVIRRLEQELGGLPSRETAAFLPTPVEAPEPEAPPPLKTLSVTPLEPLEPEEAPSEQPASSEPAQAHSALASFMRRLRPGGRPS